MLFCLRSSEVLVTRGSRASAACEWTSSDLLSRLAFLVCSGVRRDSSLHPHDADKTPGAKRPSPENSIVGGREETCTATALQRDLSTQGLPSSAI